MQRDISPNHQMSLNMTNWKSVKQIQTFLKNNGYKKIGTGAFAEAWIEKNSNTVIKISTEEDACWLRYARWVMKQRPNPHLPKIHSLRTYHTKTGELFISRVEKLNEIDAYYNNIDNVVGKLSDIKAVAEMLWVRSLEYDGGESPNSKGLIFKSMSKSPLRKTRMFNGVATTHMVSRILKMANRGLLASTVRKAHREILKDCRCYKDLHSGNIMQRKDGTIVIIDPAAMFETE